MHLSELGISVSGQACSAVILILSGSAGVRIISSRERASGSRGCPQ